MGGMALAGWGCHGRGSMPRSHYCRGLTWLIPAPHASPLRGAISPHKTDTKYAHNHQVRVSAMLYIEIRSMQCAVSGVCDLAFLHFLHPYALHYHAFMTVKLGRLQSTGNGAWLCAGEKGRCQGLG